MRRRSVPNRKGLLVLPVLVVFAALALTGGAAAITDENGTEQDSLVEVTVADRGELDALVGTGADVAEYIRYNDDGTLTTQVMGTDAELQALADAGYSIGVTIQDYNDYLARLDERQAAIDASNRGAGGGETGEQQRRSSGCRLTLGPLRNRGTRGRHPTGRLLPELRRPLHLGRGVRRCDQLFRHRRTNAVHVMGGGGRRLLGGLQHVPVHRPRPDSRHVHVPPRDDSDRCGRLDDSRAEDGARGDEHGRRPPGRGPGHGIRLGQPAGRAVPARIPEHVHRPLHESDGALQRFRADRGRVPEHFAAHQRCRT